MAKASWWATFGWLGQKSKWSIPASDGMLFL